MAGKLGSPPQVRGKRLLGEPFKAETGITPADAGKTGSNTKATKEAQGSPPRMRGKLRCCCHCASPPRITPADAGKTHLHAPLLLLPEDHPRGCGENAIGHEGDQGIKGSPPRMRGKLNNESLGILLGRITPADAGKTSARLSRQTFRLDHPRGCGENTMSPFLYKAVSGSPPRMRGKLNCRVTSSTRIRITPADAGKTKLSLPVDIVYKDHPRGCGENEPCGSDNQRHAGSPPRMRGKRPSASTQIFRRGITPADAGKTRFQEAFFSAAWDHPRGCGENHFFYNPFQQPQGSPPQVRGKLFFFLFFAFQRRITPAGAGKTYFKDTDLAGAKDHPRRCGENFKVVCAKESPLGSPPQVRGKLLEIARKNGKTWITPAGAGKTCF